MKIFHQTRAWCWPRVLAVVVLAIQCNAPPAPPLPTTPTAPVLQIALLSPAEGEMATFGRIARNGTIMAFDEWNAQGGILGHHIEWTVYDTACTYDSARQAVEQAIDEGHRFIIGPVCSEAAIAAATVAGAEQVLMISPTATHPLVTVDGQGQTRPTVFRAAYAWPRQAQAAARFAYNNLQAKRVALLIPPNDDYASTLAHTFAATFSAGGGQVVYRDNIPPEDNELAEQFAAIRQAGAAVLYLPAEAMLVNRIAGQAPADLILLGSDSWESPALDRAATDNDYFTTHFVLADDRPVAQAWRNAYKSTHAVDPNTLAALSYDAATLLLSAIEIANSFEPTAVAGALEKGDFEGVTGRIRYDEAHNPLKSVLVVQIDRQRFVFVEAVASQ